MEVIVDGKGNSITEFPLVGGVRCMPVVFPSYSSSVKAADGQVKAGAGFLHSLTFSQTDAAPTAGSVTVYDSLTETGTVLYTQAFTTTAFSPYTVTLDVAFATGLYIGFTTTADVSVSVSYS